MVRKTLINGSVVGLLAAFLPWKACPLGLGEITLTSRLNQPLEAEIALYAVRQTPIEAISAALASKEAFVRAGVERALVLSHLRFRLVRQKTGEIVIEVITQRPVHVPFLDFLVAVTWPQGHLLREYTILLDPPFFLESTSKRLEANTTTVYGPTQPGDTLWLIAQHLRPSPSVTLQQMMLALQRANPNAFLHSNINGLVAGAVLQVPSKEAVLKLSPAEALRHVQQQNRAWARLREQGMAREHRALAAAAEKQKAGLGAEAKGDVDSRVVSEPHRLQAGAFNEERSSTKGQLFLALDALQGQIQRQGELRARLQAIEQARHQTVAEQVVALQRFLEVAKQASMTTTAAASALSQRKGVVFSRLSVWRNLFLWGGSLLLLALVILWMRRRPGGVDSQLEIADEILRKAGARASRRGIGSERGFEKTPENAVLLPFRRPPESGGSGLRKGKRAAVLKT